MYKECRRTFEHRVAGEQKKKKGKAEGAEKTKEEISAQKAKRRTGEPKRRQLGTTE